MPAIFDCERSFILESPYLVAKGIFVVYFKCYESVASIHGEEADIRANKINAIYIE